MGLSDMPAEAMNKPRLFRGREGKIKRLKAGSHHWQAKGVDRWRVVFGLGECGIEKKKISKFSPANYRSRFFRDLFQKEEYCIFMVGFYKLRN